MNVLTPEAPTAGDHDPLTRLPGRGSVIRALGAALDAGGEPAVVMLGVDRLTAINDGLGHRAGDAVLRTVAQRLLAGVDAEDLVARFGGDEFVVVRRDGGERAAIACARQLLAAVREPVADGPRRLVVAASAGIAVPSGPGGDADGLLRDAHVALRRAKAEGGGRWSLFDTAMRDRIRRRAELEHDLRAALRRDELTVAYQPLVGLDAPRVVGVEALARWEHPRLGLVAPATFIPVAEESGLIAELGERVLHEACRQLATWAADPAIDLPALAVNLSGRQVADPGLPDLVATILRRTGAPADRLVLEVTESVLMRETAAPAAVLQRLKALGVRLVLDDFGTGWSSLSCLKRFPIDGLKVDRSFVAGLADDDEDRHILAAIVRMAQGLRLDVVAEGVETLEQARWVRDLGCHAAQGYHFAAPAPAAELAPLLRAGLPADRLTTVWHQPPMLATAPEPEAPAPERAPDAPEPGADEPTVPLREAAEVLGISASTLRRWADSGRIHTLRTRGGHRRFPVSELQRLKRCGTAPARPVLRLSPLPSAPLPATAALLAACGPELVGTAARSIYEGTRRGWLAGDDAEAHLLAWAHATAAACERGDYSAALDAAATLTRRARCAGATLLERQLLVERCGELLLHLLREDKADRAEVVGARRLFARLRQSLLHDAPAGL